MKIPTLRHLLIFSCFVACSLEKNYDPPLVVVTQKMPTINTTIRAVQEAVFQSETGYLQFESDTPLWLEGFVVSSDKAGNFYKELFIQDNWKDPDRALRLLLNQQALYTRYPLGRKVYIRLNGLGAGYQNGVLSLGSFQADGVIALPESLIATHLKRDSLQEQLQPFTLRIQDFHTNDLGKYIQIIDVQFSQSEIKKTFAGEAFDLYDGERRLEQCSDYHSTWMLTSTYSDFKSQQLPHGKGQVKGVLTRNYYNEYFVLKINTPAAVEQPKDRCDPPYGEAFETFRLGKIASHDWTNWREKGTQYWEIFRDENALGQSARIGSYKSGDSQTISWLITPRIDLSGLEHPRLAFRTSVAFGDSSKLAVYMATNWSGDTNEIKKANWAKLPAVLAHKGFDASEWVESGWLELATSPNTHLAFVYSGSGKTTQDGSFELDDIRIIETPN